MQKPASLLWIFCIFTFALAGPTQAAVSSDNPITIAFVCDFSGVAGGHCQQCYNAATMALDELNQDGGLLGKKIVLIKKNGGIDPKRHYEYVSELGSREDIAAVFGGGSSKVILEASRAAKERRIPYLISMGNSQQVIVDYGHPYVFLFSPSSYMETRAFSIVATLMPWREFAWLGPDYVWGREVFRYFQQHFEALGTPIEWVTQAWHPLGCEEYGPYIRQIIKTDPEALFIASWGKDLRKVVEQAKQYGLSDKMAIFSQSMAEEPNAPVIEGVWGFSRGPIIYLSEKYPQTKSFVERYHERYQIYPSGFAFCSYDAVLAWKQAVINADTTEREAVAKALKGISFEGLRGSSTIRAIDGQMSCSTYCGRIAIKPEYPVPVLESIIEIPAEKLWQTESEIIEARKNAK